MDPRPPGRRTHGASLALKALAGYKRFVSPFFHGSCRFLPSCADYMSEAIARHGAVRGMWLGIGRLLRCQPFCRAGHDPVPFRFSLLAGFVGKTQVKESGASSR